MDICLSYTHRYKKVWGPSIIKNIANSSASEKKSIIEFILWWDGVQYLLNALCLTIKKLLDMYYKAKVKILEFPYFAKPDLVSCFNVWHFLALFFKNTKNTPSLILRFKITLFWDTNNRDRGGFLRRNSPCPDVCLWNQPAKLKGLRGEVEEHSSSQK